MFIAPKIIAHAVCAHTHIAAFSKIVFAAGAGAACVALAVAAKVQRTFLDVAEAVTAVELAKRDIADGVTLQTSSTLMKIKIIC